MMPSLPRNMPDPARAHGAWVYLIVSVLAGALSVAGQGFMPALFAGVGYVGIFLLASSVALWPRPRWRRRFASGFLLAAGAPVLALLLDGDPSFFAYALIAAFPAGAAVWFSVRQGFQSPVALCFAVAALVVAAPSAACAGGGSAQVGWMLVLLLTPFFLWRTWSIRSTLTKNKSWTRDQLRKQGMREAGIAVIWTALCVALIHIVAV